MRWEFWLDIRRPLTWPLGLLINYLDFHNKGHWGKFKIRRRRSRKKNPNLIKFLKDTKEKTCGNMASMVCKYQDWWSPMWSLQGGSKRQ